MDGNYNIARRRKALEARDVIFRAIREFFYKEGFLEVETPLRIPAPAPESHIDAIPSDGWFLQTSPELCMKRLLSAGHKRIFQISHCWRFGERGRLHLPEFTMLEWYRAEADYTSLMTDCEKLIKAASNAVQKSGNIQLTQPWERLTVRESFIRYTSHTMDEALALDRFDELMVEAIEPNLGRNVPTFLCDYPAQRAALSKLKADDPSVSERFELYINGVELANGFSELTNVVEQKRRFREEEAFRRSQGRPPYPEPLRFLEELPNMPASAGIALGLDRLVMVLLDIDCIDDVVAFTPENL